MKLPILFTAAIVIAIAGCESEDPFEPPGDPATPTQPSAQTVTVVGHLESHGGRLMLDASRGQWTGQLIELVGDLVDELRKHADSDCIVFGKLADGKIDVHQYSILYEDELF